MLFGEDSLKGLKKELKAAGADMIFAEAVHTLQEYQEYTKALKVPVLAKISKPVAKRFEKNEGSVIIDSIMLCKQI